jgi:disulfide bond formation protein DsbB
MTIFHPVLTRHASALILAASAGILGTAFAFQYLGDIQPCVLCIYQRYLYGAIIALALVSVGHVLAGRRKVEPYLLLACGLVFLAGVGVAGFHIGVEQKWWEGTAECGALGPAPDSLEALKAQIMAAPLVRCDEVPWSLFGISMAGYNFLMSLGLAGFALMVGREKLTKARRA